MKVFLRPDLDPEPFKAFSKDVKLFIWHHGINYDWPVLTKWKLDGIITLSNTLDTLVLSRLVYQSRPGGHSLEAWGEYFKVPKVLHNEFHEYSPQILERCISDTLINKYLYNYLERFLKDFSSALEVEQWVSYSCYHQIHCNGFKIDTERLYSLHSSLSNTVASLTAQLQEVFPPRSKLIREITPKLTKHGTLNAQDFRWLKSEGTDQGIDLSVFSPGATFSRFELVSFNPGSPQQVVQILNEAGWKPVNKTDGHKDEEKIKASSLKTPEERARHQERLAHFRTYGWSIDEDNLATVPSDAPDAIRLLVRWRMLQSRVSKIDEWIEALRGTDTIHPTITSIGTVTHRASHTDPNVGNIPSVAPKYDPKGPIYPEASNLGKQLRSLWIARPGRILVGTDADGIQLRVLAHYMGDANFIEALINGRKEDGTDAHSLNKQALGPVCATRDVAKTFIYAWLLGAGVSKVAQILSCSVQDARGAISSFVSAYPGLTLLKEEIIPRDARNGWYRGFDGRKVIPKGRDYDERVYYMLSGYLQNGEAVIMKHAQMRWEKEAKALGIPYWLVNWVHDEWQTETEDTDTEFPYRLGEIQSRSITEIGSQLGVLCPLAGQSKYGYNWLETH